jgi:protein required for attachment to host cells
MKRPSQPGYYYEEPSGSGSEEQTHRQTDEATFAKQLAQKLYLRLHHGEFESMALIADRKHCQLLDAMHKSVARATVRPIDNDLTDHSSEAIAEALSHFE